MATTTLGTPGRKTKPMGTIYWTIAVVVLLCIAIYFAMRTPTTPSETQGTVNTEARSGEIGSSGAATETEAVPARTNDTDQR